MFFRNQLCTTPKADSALSNGTVFLTSKASAINEHACFVQAQAAGEKGEREGKGGERGGSEQEKSTAASNAAAQLDSEVRMAQRNAESAVRSKISFNFCVLLSLSFFSRRTCSISS